MLNKGAKGELAEGVAEEAELFRSTQDAGNDSHVTQLLYGGGPAFTNSGGQLWTAGYIDSIGGPTCDLRSKIAAEARAKIVYERLINVTADPGVREALGFLMTREVSHQKSFEKALYAIEPNFPPGKTPPVQPFDSIYINTSQGEGDQRGPWNAEQHFTYISDRNEQTCIDSGDGKASVNMTEEQQRAVNAMAKRTASDPNGDPATGVELGSAGRLR